MKTKYLLLFILLICSLTSKAEEKTVTFKASEDRTDEKTLSKEGISISMDNGIDKFNKYSSNVYYYLFSSADTLRFNSSIGNIYLLKEIVI